MQQSVGYLSSSFENLALKRPREFGTVPVFDFFLRVDSGTPQSSAIVLLLSAASKFRVRLS